MVKFWLWVPLVKKVTVISESFKFKPNPGYVGNFTS